MSREKSFPSTGDVLPPPAASDLPRLTRLKWFRHARNGIGEVGQRKSEASGISLAAIREFAGKIPLLGVCLGHQSIGEAFGGRVIHAKKLMHGKVSPVHHNDIGVFKGMPNPITCTRYHSLAVERESLPDCLEITAWTEDGEIMGLRHKTLAVEGVQFHPESILTERGHDMLNNFLKEYAR